MNILARITNLEANRSLDAKASLAPDLWPLIGSRHTHEDFIGMLAREVESDLKGGTDGHA